MEAECVLPGGTTRPMGRFVFCLHPFCEIPLEGFLSIATALCINFWFPVCLLWIDASLYSVAGMNIMLLGKMVFPL